MLLVRFHPDLPKFQWADSSTVECFNGIEEMQVQFLPCPPFIVILHQFQLTVGPVAKTPRLHRGTIVGSSPSPSTNLVKHPGCKVPGLVTRWW